MDNRIPTEVVQVKAREHRTMKARFSMNPNGLVTFASSHLNARRICSIIKNKRILGVGRKTLLRKRTVSTVQELASMEIVVSMDKVLVSMEEAAIVVAITRMVEITTDILSTITATQATIMVAMARMVVTIQDITTLLTIMANTKIMEVASIKTTLAIQDTKRKTLGAQIVITLSILMITE